MRAVLLGFIAVALYGQQQGGGLKPPEVRRSAEDEKIVLNMARKISKEVRSLPQYGVFDMLRFSIKGIDTVILRGYASRPTLKDGAERVVKNIEGVEKVVNEIQVLPLSPADNDVRWGVYRNIYWHPALERYNPNRGTPLYASLTRQTMGMTQDPPEGNHPIHIIVNKGNVTLEGVVLTTGDRTIAELQANAVPGVFSVVNNIVATRDDDGDSDDKNKNKNSNKNDSDKQDLKGDKKP